MDIGTLVALGLLAAPVNVEPVVTFDPEPALMAATQVVTITYDFGGGWRAANGRPEPMVVTYTPLAKVVLPDDTASSGPDTCLITGRSPARPFRGKTDNGQPKT